MRERERDGGDRLLRTYGPCRAQNEYPCDGDGTKGCKCARYSEYGCVMGEMILASNLYEAEVWVQKFTDQNGIKRSTISTKRYPYNCPHCYDDPDDWHKTLGRSDDEKETGHSAEVVPAPAPAKKAA